MSGVIDFGVWAPDEATFWASWEAAGIIEYDVDGNRHYTAEYQGIEVTSSWPGIVTKTPAVEDEDGNIITPAVLVSGWHCNVRVTGPLVAEMTYGLPQHNEDGTLKDVLMRTWAMQLFGLEWSEADPVTGFPAGCRNADGITYSDTRNFSSPDNVWL